MDFQQSRASAYAQQGAQNASNVGGMWQGLLGAGLGGAMGGAFGSLGGLINLGGQGGNEFGQNLMGNMGMLNEQPGYQMPSFGGGLQNMSNQFGG